MPVSDTLPADATLDEIRLALAPAIAAAAVFDGWSEAAVDAAAGEHGVDPAVARFAFQDGSMAMISAWIARIDADMAKTLPADVLAKRKVRERIGDLVRFRLAALTGKEEALRRALAIMARPKNASTALKLGWSSADAMWRLAGDVATDYNHYSKRTILASIYAATLAVFAEDKSEGHADTYAFLDRRIDGVMKFEKAKAQFLKPRDETFSVTRLLGRLRYPAR